jgi:hypothetical protein
MIGCEVGRSSPEEDRRNPTNSKGKQVVMDEPITLEIFTDYV